MDYQVGRLAIAVAITVIIISVIWQLWINLLWRPYEFAKRFHKQGIRGHPYSFFSGSLREIKRLKQLSAATVLDPNSHVFIHRIIPHYHKWWSEYGEIFTYWFGLEPRICISDPELAKNILANKFGFSEKPKARPAVIAMVGRGLVLANGLEWVKHRRIINPAFATDKIKVLVGRMAACGVSTLDAWKAETISAADRCMKIEINIEFQKLTSDIIAHAAFGTSYLQGREAFDAQKELQQCSIKSSADVFIPGSQYLPTPTNVRIWKLDRKLKGKLMSIVKDRLKKSEDYGDDLLGMMIAVSESAESEDGNKLNRDEIVEECKTFFFAGHETTSSLLTWSVFLLCRHPEWQDRLRQEVFEECGPIGNTPDADILSKLKLVNMFLLETLRMYGPVIEMLRETTADITAGNLTIPKGTCISIPVAKIHRDIKYWGKDANEFNPLRFVNGVLNAAKHPNALMPFGLGPRTCIGQNFATLEAKTILTLLLQRFYLSLAPEYKHAPANYFLLQPQHGLPVLLKPLEE